MSAYQIEKLIYRATHDAAFRSALSADAESVIAAQPLTDEERDILRKGEVEKFYQMGVHPYLLGHLTRFGIFNITTDHYRERMRLINADGTPRQ